MTLRSRNRSKGRPGRHETCEPIPKPRSPEAKVRPFLGLQQEDSDRV